MSLVQHYAYEKLSAFSIGSYELDAVSGGSHRYADAVDELSLSSEASGLMDTTPALGNESGTFDEAADRLRSAFSL